MLNLARGCNIIILRNIVYLFGLADGTMGTLIGVVYGPGGIGSFPEAIVVEVPNYTGPAFYPAEPKRVVILPQASMKDGTRMTRTQFPLGPGFAMTVNKAQGLQFKEGVVINLAGTARLRPASKHGLPFVAYTRSENFAMTAFKNLPPWGDFCKGKDSPMLHSRQKMIAELQQKTHSHHGHTQQIEDSFARGRRAGFVERGTDQAAQKAQSCTRGDAMPKMR